MILTVSYKLYDSVKYTQYVIESHAFGTINHTLIRRRQCTAIAMRHNYNYGKSLVIMQNIICAKCYPYDVEPINECSGESSYDIYSGEYYRTIIIKYTAVDYYSMYSANEYIEISYVMCNNGRIYVDAGGHIVCVSIKHVIPFYGKSKIECGYFLC